MSHLKMTSSDVGGAVWSMTSYPDILNATLRSQDEEFPLLMPRWGYVVSAFVLFLIGFFGFFLNLLVILLMFKDRQLWTPLNIILFNLVCSDFSVSVLGNPFTLISALFHRWVFGPTLCMLYGFFMALLGITSITTLTVISFERYMLVSRPLSSRHLSSRGAALSVLFIWLYSLALTTPPLLGWGNYVSEAANISCSVNWHEQSTNTLTYILFLFAMGQVVPMAVITYSYVNIIRTMKKNSQRLGRARVSRAEGRATHMVLLMIVAFTVAWTPYSVFALMEQFATDGIISPGAGVIPALVAKSSICYNPLIYVGMNTQFRQSIKRIFGIHNKRTNSHLGRKHNTLSPARQLTSINDITTNFNIHSDYLSSSQQKKSRKPSDDTIDTCNENARPYPRNLELCTIQENKPGSDVEQSGDTIEVYDEDSCQSVKKLNVNVSKILNEHSPILTIVDAERTVFAKTKKIKLNNANEILMNRYGDQACDKHCTDVTEPRDLGHGNQAYEDHCTDVTEPGDLAHFETVASPKIKHSFSLDLSVVQNEGKLRKLSIETKLEGFSQGVFKDTVISKILAHAPKPNDNYKSFLCSDSHKSDEII